MKITVIRVAATILWFMAAWSAAGLLVGLAGLPSAVASVGGIAVAMVVWFDPTGRLWPRAATRRVRPVEEVAAELEQASRGSLEAVKRASR